MRRRRRRRPRGRPGVAVAADPPDPVVTRLARSHARVAVARVRGAGVRHQRLPAHARVDRELHPVALDPTVVQLRRRPDEVDRPRPPHRRQQPHRLARRGVGEQRHRNRLAYRPARRHSVEHVVVDLRCHPDVNGVAQRKMPAAHPHDEIVKRRGRNGPVQTEGQVEPVVEANHRVAGGVERELRVRQRAERVDVVAVQVGDRSHRQVRRPHLFGRQGRRIEAADLEQGVVLRGDDHRRLDRRRRLLPRIRLPLRPHHERLLTLAHRVVERLHRDHRARLARGEHHLTGRHRLVVIPRHRRPVHRQPRHRHRPAARHRQRQRQLRGLALRHRHPRNHHLRRRVVVGHRPRRAVRRRVHLRPARRLQHHLQRLRRLVQRVLQRRHRHRRRHLARRERHRAPRHRHVVLPRHRGPVRRRPRHPHRVTRRPRQLQRKRERPALDRHRRRRRRRIRHRHRQRAAVPPGAPRTAPPPRGSGPSARRPPA